MKHIVVLLSMLLILGAAGVVSAQDNDHGGHGAMAKEAPPKDGGNHAGMQMGGAMIMLGAVSVDGIKAEAHLQDMRSNMAHGAAGATHNFMVGFEEEGKGNMIGQGRAAIKITGPDGQTGNGINLTPQDGFFRGDVELKQPGKYTLVVGSKLNDGKARQFSFAYELK